MRRMYPVCYEDVGGSRYHGSTNELAFENVACLLPNNHHGLSSQKYVSLHKQEQFGYFPSIIRD